MCSDNLGRAARCCNFLHGSTKHPEDTKTILPKEKGEKTRKKESEQKRESVQELLFAALDALPLSPYATLLVYIEEWQVDISNKFSL